MDFPDHTVAVCTTWAHERKILVAMLGDGDLSLPNIIRFILSSRGAWIAFSQYVERAKEAMKRAGWNRINSPRANFESDDFGGD